MSQNVIERERARKSRRLSHRQQDFLLDRRRVSELSKLARLRHPDRQGDYVLPETARHLAMAIITHLLRRPGAKGAIIFQFCHERAPWLDPNEIDMAQLLPSKAEALGKRLQLTTAERTQLGITTIAPCDQTAEQRAAARKERRRQYDRERQRQKREAERGMTRAQWEAAHSLSRSKPWEAEGVSRRTWYRRRGTGTSPSKEHFLPGEQPVPPSNGTAGRGGRVGRPATVLETLVALIRPSRQGSQPLA